MKKEVDFNIFKAQILEEIKAGKPLFGKDGALAPMIENIVNAVLEGEMDAHLTQESRKSGNRRNGKMQKQVHTPVGDITVTTPKDRDASFNPQFIKKRETMLSEGMVDRIIGLYALGTSTRDISSWLEVTIGTSVSAEIISSITDRVLPELEAWRNRSLDEVYPIVWLDALHYKVMDEKNRVVSRAIYNVLGIDKDGHKDLLGMYVSKSEGANFWLSVLTDLQNRGVKDIMIACIDGLKGFPDAIKSVFPDTAVQLCVINQIRNSMKYVGSKYHDFLDLLGKPVAEATTTEMLIIQKRLMEASGKSMCFSPYVPALGNEIACPSVEKVLITWQKDDASPFVAMRLKHESCFGGAIDRLATRLSTWFVFKAMSRRYALFLKRNDIEVHMRELDWRPEGSRFGACHCLELSLLFESWERLKGAGMLGQTDEAEWKKHSQELRKQWLQFIK